MWPFVADLFQLTPAQGAPCRTYHRFNFLSGQYYPTVCRHSSFVKSTLSFYKSIHQSTCAYTVSLGRLLLLYRYKTSGVCFDVNAHLQFSWVPCCEWSRDSDCNPVFNLWRNRHRQSYHLGIPPSVWRRDLTSPCPFSSSIACLLSLCFLGRCVKSTPVWFGFYTR